MDIHDRLHYEEAMRILFLRNETNGAFEPIMYECDLIDGEYTGKRIVPNTLYHDLIKFVRRLSEEVDKNSGQKGLGYFELYQWHIALIAVRCFAELKSTDLLVSLSRQSGKSYFARAMFSFSVVFIPSYIKIKQARYAAAWGSPTMRLATDHFEKIKDYISIAVELFNEIHPESPLLTKEDSKDIKENKNTIEIDRETPSGVIQYSVFYLLTLNAKVINCG